MALAEYRSNYFFMLNTWRSGNESPVKLFISGAGNHMTRVLAPRSTGSYHDWFDLLPFPINVLYLANGRESSL